MKHDVEENVWLDFGEVDRTKSKHANPFLTFDTISLCHYNHQTQLHKINLLLSTRRDCG